MKPLYFCILILILGCSETPKNTTGEPTVATLEPKSVDSTSQPIISDFSLSFDQQNHTLNISHKGTIILEDTIDGGLDYLDYTIEDVNNDNLLDFRVMLPDADALTENWYIQDSSKLFFSKVTGLPWIVNPIKLDSPSNYYFTQDPQGCAGNIWISHLIEVKKSKIIIKGKVFYSDCSEGVYEDESGLIECYKFQNDNIEAITESDSVKQLLLEHYRGTTDGLSIKDYWLTNNEKYN